MTHPPAQFPARLALPAEILTIATTLEEAGFEAWCVGGALRDFLLGDPQQDVDLATAAPPEAVQRLFRHTVPVGIQHGTVGVLDRHRRLHEVTTFRRDVSTDGRHAVVAYGVSLEDDLARRDFTINALAYHPLRHEWRDPFHGLRDLHDGLVRAVGVPEQRFREDFLRVLRAFRFAARFGFRIEPATWDAITAAVPGLSGLSAERVRDEWFKGLLSARSVMEFVRFWRESGAAAVLLPELRAAPIIAAPEHPPRDPVLLSMLLVDRPDQVLLRLRASSADVARAGRYVQAAKTPDGEDAATVRRWMHAAGEAVDDLLAAHHRTTGAPASWEGMVAGIRERGEAVNRTGLALSGHDLAGAGIPPGPAMGRLLDQLLDAVLTDPSLNTRERLLERARKLA